MNYQIIINWRIHWDKEFGKAEFELWFLDHAMGHEGEQLVKLKLHEITFLPGDHYFFYYMDDQGTEHNVPLHRIKAVYKNGELIWHREH